VFYFFYFIVLSICIIFVKNVFLSL